MHARKAGGRPALERRGHRSHEARLERSARDAHASVHGIAARRTGAKWSRSGGGWWTDRLVSEDVLRNRSWVRSVLGFMIRSSFGLALVFSMTSFEARAGDRSPVIVELFTSGGCSSCPPAAAVLARLEHNRPVPSPPILSLGLHVRYWKQL